LLFFGFEGLPATSGARIRIPQEVAASCGLKTHDALCRSLVWEGDWRTDVFMASLKETDEGNPVKLVLTVCGQVKGAITLFLFWIPNHFTSASSEL